MRNLIMLFAIALLPFAGNAITLEEAVKAVYKNLPADRQENSMLYVGEPDANTWMVFEDLMPGAGWCHPAKTYIISKSASSSNPKFIIEDVTGLPSVSLSRYNGNDNFVRSTSGFIEVNVPKRDVPAATKQHVVIISGGYDKYNNEVRYWNNTSLIYRVMRNHFNVPKENIYVLYSNGYSPKPDMDNKVTAPRDLDGDGEDDFYGAATVEEFDALFTKLSKELYNTDHLFVFVTDHGAPINTKNEETEDEGTSICMWDQELLTAKHFAKMVDPLTCASLNFVFGQCFSGGFIEKLNTRENRIIATACRKDQEAYSDDFYGNFLKVWINSLWKEDCLKLADSNKNGVINMEEAFIYARDNDSTFITGREVPQYYCGNENLKNALSFDFSPKPWNLVIRDTYEDNGEYSNILRNLNSPDVTVRTSLDNDSTFMSPAWVPPLYRDNYVKVRIQNKGWAPYNPDKGMYKVTAYWSIGGLVSNIRDYKGATKNDDGLARGGLIGSVDLDQQLQPGEEVVVTIPWSYGTPNKYRLGPINLYAEVTGAPALTALASEDYKPSRYPNTAERHYTVVDRHPWEVELELNMTYIDSKSATLKFDGITSSGIHSYYIISEDLFGTDEKKVFDSKTNQITINNLSKKRYKAKVGCELVSDPDQWLLEPGEHLTLSLKDSGTDEALGEYHLYNAGQRPTIPGLQSLGITEKDLGNNVVELSAIGVESDGLSLEWRDDEGNLLSAENKYIGKNYTIDGGCLVVRKDLDTIEIPLELSVTPIFSISESGSDYIMITADGLQDDSATVEVVHNGIQLTSETFAWTSDCNTMRVSLPATEGLTIVSVIHNDNRNVIYKHLNK